MSWFTGWFTAFARWWSGIDGKVKQVQELTVKACKFLPEAASVAAMLTASNPAVVGVVAIANAICVIVNRPTPVVNLYGGGVDDFTVNGVVVEGEWVK